jgi:glycosyltransferase involved in cell wall biosynthesis
MPGSSGPSEHTSPRSRRLGEDRIRIAHFLWGRCNPESANGIDKTVYYLAREQAAAGQEVAIFSINDKPPIPVPGCEVKSYPVRRFPLAFVKGRLRDLLVLRSPLNLPPSLRDDLIQWNPSMVHFHFVHLPQAIMLARRVRKRGIPYCVTPHGGLAVEGQRRGRLGKKAFGLLFERRYLNRAAFIHAISTEDVEGTRAYGARNRFVIAPNCIDPDIMPPDVDGTLIRRRIPSVAGKRLFTYVGRLDPQQKGLDLLLRAWAGLPSRDRCSLVLVGPDWRGGRAQLEGISNELGIADSVWFFGPVAGKDRWDVLAGSDVFVHPSRWEAGVPFAVLEAMLAAKPLLLTARADPTGLVAQNGTGLVVPPIENDIRDALVQLVDAEAGQLQRLGLSARDLVEREFRWDRTSERLLKAYQEASTSAW